MSNHHEVGPLVDAMLAQLWELNGSDLLLAAGTPPQLRVDGALRPIEGHAALSSDDTDALLDEILTDEQQARWKDAAEFDFAFGWRSLARVRGNAFTQRGSTAVALRVIPTDIPSPDALGLPPALLHHARQHQGLILLTGPTGSGKSTTLASVIDVINTERPCHVITIEDPIEYIHKHKRAVVNQRQVGADTGSFSDALRAALREDPDVLLVGEMRDLESIRFALTIAETGHLVFGTLHTNDTAQSLSRMIDVFPADQQEQIRVQLAASLSVIVYQRLIPRVGGGVVAAFETLVGTPAVRNLIKDGKTHQLRNQLVTGHREGMLTLETSLSALVQNNVVTYDDAVMRSLYPKEIESRARLRASATS